ncbi:MAG: ATP-binding protein [Armatimonadota bacterium]|nr:ATP-binding protein [Armatimonadota bacterium]
MTAEREIGVRIVDIPEPTVIVDGDLDFTSAPQFEQAVDSLLRRRPGIVVELSNAGFIDSSGVAALLNAHRQAMDAEKTFELRGIGDQARKALRISGFGQVFGIDPLRMENVSLPDPAMRSTLNRANWQISESVVVGRPLLVTELRQTAVEAAREAGLSESEVSDVKLAVGEALTNALKHAARPGRDRIRLRCLACPAALVLEISDQGRGFNPDTVPTPISGVLRGGGLGIHLMRSTMDEVEFTGDEHGSKVRMLKWIHGRDE